MVLSLPEVNCPAIGEVRPISSVTLVRASAESSPSASFPNQVVYSHPDLCRRLTPIPCRSQRLNTFFVFNHSGHWVRGRDSHIAVRCIRERRVQQVGHPLEHHNTCFRHEKRRRHELRIIVPAKIQRCGFAISVDDRKYCEFTACKIQCEALPATDHAHARQSARSRLLDQNSGALENRK
jgi:hypothetical protein